MSYKKIDTLLENTKGLLTLLNEYDNIFNEIDDIGCMLLNNAVECPKDLDKLMTKATGMYVSLNVVAGLAEAKLIWAKEKSSEDRKLKMIDGIDADVLITFRRVRNIFKNYTECAEKIITTCQSKIKNAKYEQFS